jgi:membrane-bound ClpP family serine protease
MIGTIATALTAVDSAGGKVMVDGENWSAVSESPVAPGARVEILGLEGLILRVKPKA